MNIIKPGDLVDLNDYAPDFTGVYEKKRSNQAQTEKTP